MNQLLEKDLAQFPIFESGSLKIEDIIFENTVRYICENECSMYGTSWSCPPAVGTVEVCKAKCGVFKNVYVFTTVAEVTDMMNLEEMLLTRKDHEEITNQVCDCFRQYYEELLVLSTESCEICAECTYPGKPCRYPERMYPCVESYGILVTDVAEKCDLSFFNGSNVVTWFSMVFY